MARSVHKWIAEKQKIGKRPNGERGMEGSVGHDRSPSTVHHIYCSMLIPHICCMHG